MNIILLFFAIKYQGDWHKIYNALNRKEKVTVEDLKNIEQKIIKEKISFFTILDPIYPEGFKSIYNPPFVIFYKGNIKILNKKGFVFTGNRYQNQHNTNNINLLYPEIFDNKILISSFYKGVDQLVYEKAKDKTNIIFISANNINNPYAAINMSEFNLSKNLVISEYYDNKYVTKTTLRARNRLLVALSQAVILVSSDLKSGLNNLVSNALNNGKDILCLPDDPKNLSGNSALIKEGATLITKYQDLINII